MDRKPKNHTAWHWMTCKHATNNHIDERKNVVSFLFILFFCFLTDEHWTLNDEHLRGWLSFHFKWNVHFECNFLVSRCDQMISCEMKNETVLHFIRRFCVKFDTDDGSNDHDCIHRKYKIEVKRKRKNEFGCGNCASNELLTVIWNWSFGRTRVRHSITPTLHQLN